MNARLRGSNRVFPGWGWQLAAAERAEQVGAGDGLGEPVHHRVVDGQRRAGDDRQGQAVGQAGGDLPGPAGHGDVYPRGGHPRAQVGDGHGGHGDPGRVQQLAGHLPGIVDGVFGVAGAGEQAPEHAVVGQPDRQRPVPGVVGEHHKADWLAFWPGVGVRDTDGSHGGPPGGGGDKVGAVRGDVLAQPAAGLVQAGLGGAGSAGDPAFGLVGVVEQGDGVALPGGQAGDRAAQHVGAVQVLSRRQAGRRRPGAGSRASRRAGSAGRGAAGRGRRWPRCRPASRRTGRGRAAGPAR